MLKSGAADCKQQQLFHGTGVEGLEGIPKNGFRVPEWSDGNIFGRGIYFESDSSKSAQEMYTKGSKALILCDVLLGHACVVPGLTAQHALSKYVKTSKTGRPFLDVDEKKIRKEGFDSVYAPRDTRANAGVLFDEMIVYNPSQAIPRYVIHFGQVHSNQKWQNDPTCLYGKATVIILCDISEQKTSDRISRENLTNSTWLQAIFGAFLVRHLALHARSSESMCMKALSSNQRMKRRSLNSVRCASRWRRCGSSMEPAQKTYRASA